VLSRYTYTSLSLLAIVLPLMLFLYIRVNLGVIDAGFFAFASTLIATLAVLPSIFRNTIERILPVYSSNVARQLFVSINLVSAHNFFVFICCMILIFIALYFGVMGDNTQSIYIYALIPVFIYNSLVNLLSIYYKSINHLTLSGFVRFGYGCLYHCIVLLALLFSDEDLVFILFFSALLGVFVVIVNAVNVFGVRSLIPYINILFYKKNPNLLKVGFSLLLFYFTTQLLLQSDIYIMKLLGDAVELSNYSFALQLIIYSTIAPSLLISSFTHKIFSSEGGYYTFVEVARAIWIPMATYFLFCIILIGLASEYFSELFFSNYQMLPFYLKVLSPTLILSVCFSFVSLFLIALGFTFQLLVLSFIVVFMSIVVKVWFSHISSSFIPMVNNAAFLIMFLYASWLLNRYYRVN
jgi:hypothetical protein